MDAATILVLILLGGVIALLVWFQMNSRRNEARRKQSSAGPGPEESEMEGRSKDEPGPGKKKAA